MSSSSESDGVSERFSLFSYPMTRASSTATECSVTTATSLEKPQTRMLSGHDVNGPRQMSRSSALMHANSPHRLGPVLETVEVDHHMRHASYFSIPPKGASIHQPVQRNKSTKELITRFESLEQNSSKTQTPIRKPLQNRVLLPAQHNHSVNISKHIINNKLANRSPLRRSFGNLLAMFGKKSDVSTKNDDRLSSTPYQPNTYRPMTKAKTKTDPLSTCPLYSGLLLYLSPPPTSDGISLPVWTDCGTTLYSTHIHIMWQTPQGNPSPHSRAIQLGSCIDVHSLALEELDPDEVALLPTREVKIFELLFKETPREKFVAASVQERAGWVSAIWDVILGKQERKKAAVYTEVSGTSSLNLPRPQTPMSNISLARQANFRAERDLPSIPLKSPDTSKSYGFSPNTLSVPCKSIDLSPRSGSILFLNKRSVVTQRLNRIEDVKLIASSRRRRTNTETPETTLERQSSVCSAGADSLLDLYQDEPTALPSTLNTRLAWTSPVLPLIPETSSEITERNDLTNDTSSPISTYTAANTDVRLGTLVELLQDQATKHYYHTNELGDQIASLHTEILGMFEELKTTVGEQPSLGVGKHVESVTKSMIGLEHQLSEMLEREGVMIEVKEKLEGIHTEIRSFMECERTGLDDMKQEMLKKMDELSRKADVPQAIIHDLESLKPATGGPDDRSAFVLGDLRPSSSHGTEGQSFTPIDFSELNGKLDNLLEKWNEGIQEIPRDVGTAEQSKLTDILALLKIDQSQRTTQTEHQKDSARYLNELNTWLETFVKDGTSKIETIASAVQEMHSEIVHAGEEPDDNTGSSGGLLANIRLLLTESKERDQSLAVLHASVNGLFAAVNDKLMDGGNALTAETVAGMLNQQRESQERMLRTIAADLSHDIKGERLRFVEAMKEATAINVQVHVEEFKKQLTKEVFLMTQEVGRLQKERQALEKQIADLFTFYAKQKDLTAGMMIAPQPAGPRI